MSQRKCTTQVRNIRATSATRRESLCTGPLDGRVIVVTGSTRGLGHAAAAAFLREGAKVVISGRSDEATRKAARELDPSGEAVLGVACDVGDLEAVRALAQRAIARFGHFDVWVNNAGQSAPYGPVADMPAEAFTAVVRTNVLGSFHGSHVALQHLLARGNGTLINILGRGDTGTVPLQLAYSSSKWWLKAFTKTLAKENEGRGVAIIGFNPGLMTTDFLTKLEALEGYEAALEPLKTVIRMWGNPPSVPAERLVALASEAFSHRNGHVEGLLGAGFMLAGALKEGGRRLVGRKGPDVALHVKTVKKVERV